MKFVKLIVMSRLYDTIYDYNKTNRSFFDDLAGLIRKQRCDPAMERKGKCQCTFYLPLPDNADIVGEVSEIIRRLGAEPSAFLISSFPIRHEEFKELEKNDTDQISKKEWFGSVRDGFAPEKEGPVTDPSSSGPVFGIGLTEKKPEKSPCDHGLSGGAPVQENGGAGEDLAGEAQRIAQLKEKLLSRVRGQRHAVDEVVQTIFECDAFNRMNEKRKGPLATFLFTGPSGVGKTFLAEVCAEALNKKPHVIDMSEYSDNLANVNFNGEHGQPANVTSIARSDPDGVIIFDEIEKAHINTIYLFLQILDSGRLMDYKVNKEVSFRNMIIFITTNAGSSLYDDPTVVDLSNVSRRAILDALRSDRKPGTDDEPFFPECITTRFANGHVLLFNHLEPYALMQIVRDEIEEQIGFISKSYGVKVEYDPSKLAALIMYASGGITDARTLRGMAKNVIVKELQDIILQTHRTSGDGVNSLKEIEFRIEPERGDREIEELFGGGDPARVLVFADEYVTRGIRPCLENNDSGTEYVFLNDPDEFKRRVRGVVDYILLDPVSLSRPMKRIPNDLEDYASGGNDLFSYLRTYFPELPVYFLDVRMHGEAAFSSMLAKGGRGVISVDPEDPGKSKDQLRELAFAALVNNSTFKLGRSGKHLTYNCSQYSIDGSRAAVSFDRLCVEYAPLSSDSGFISRKENQSGVTFDDVVGCGEAKKALKEFCSYVKEPRKMLIRGKKMPKGVLLYGPPGTGKTMLAKAMANESDAAFFPTTATAFFGSLVGDSEKNVRELFRRARRYAPSIIFIDEVDAIGRMRTGSIASIHNEDTLNEFFAQMDGFVTDERRPVFILAATNYEIAGDGGRVLDPAFVRRFDRKVYVALPDNDERFELLKKTFARHGVDFGTDHEAILKNLADRASGMSSADLTTVIDLFLRSCEDNAPTAAGLMNAFDEFRFGALNDLDPDDLRQTAYHESGHALASRLLGETPAYLTIVTRSNFAGYMEHDKNEKKSSMTYSEMMNRVCTALAGRAAEIEVFGRVEGVNTGAVSDISHARYWIKAALSDFAMGDKIYTAASDEDCEKLMREQFERASELIREHRASLDRLTELLLAKKSLNKSELERFFAEDLA